jgi:hypothetical protein
MLFILPDNVLINFESILPTQARQATRFLPITDDKRIRHDVNAQMDPKSAPAVDFRAAVFLF